MPKQFTEFARGAQAIILAAERLFGTHGLNGVSLRQIVVAAGQVNPSAVQHHFGSKRGLIQAVYEMRMPAIEAARRDKFAALGKKTRHSIEDLLAALLEPIIEVLPKPQRLIWARFMMQVLPLSDSEHSRLSASDIHAPSIVIMESMLAHFPALAADVITTRTRMAVCVFLQGICDERRVRGLVSHAYRTEDIFWDEIFQIALSIFLNDYPPPRRFGLSADLGRPARPRKPKAKATRSKVAGRKSSRAGATRGKATGAAIMARHV